MMFPGAPRQETPKPAPEPVHWLVVQPLEVIDVDDLGTFEIEHPDCVPTTDPDGVFAPRYECQVEFEAINAGVDFFFTRRGDKPTGWYPETLTPGRYLIEAWTETYRGHEFTEYDAGLRLVYPEEAQRGHAG